MFPPVIFDVRKFIICTQRTLLDS